MPPEVGDIIGFTRVKWVDDFADALGAARHKETYFSHFDVVTNVSSRVVSRVGGNASQSVTLTKVNLVNGMLPTLPFKFDAACRVLSGPFICIIKMAD